VFTLAKRKLRDHELSAAQSMYYVVLVTREFIVMGDAFGLNKCFGCTAEMSGEVLTLAPAQTFTFTNIPPFYDVTDYAKMTSFTISDSELDSIKDQVVLITGA
jgi:hypothetical protein